MAKKEKSAAPPADDVSPFEALPEESGEVQETGPASGRALKPEEKALANAGPPVVSPNPEDKKPPKYGTARKAGPGDLPRICHPLERAGPGQKRFKIVARIGRQIGNWPYRYILAETKDEAVAYYLEYQKIDRTAKDDKGNELIQCTVTELPD